MTLEAATPMAMVRLPHHKIMIGRISNFLPVLSAVLLTRFLIMEDLVLFLTIYPRQTLWQKIFRQSLCPALIRAPRAVSGLPNTVTILIKYSFINFLRP